MVTEKKDGKYIRYSINKNFNNIDKLNKLLKNHYKNIWNSWANRLGELFILLSDDDEDK